MQKYLVCIGHYSIENSKRNKKLSSILLKDVCQSYHHNRNNKE